MSSIWRENILGYLSADIICSEKRTVRSRKTVSIYPGKYPSIFLKSNGGFSVYYPSNIFRNTRDLPVCDMSITSKFNFIVCQLASKIPMPLISLRTDFALAERICLGEKYNINFDCTLEALSFWKSGNIAQIFPRFSWGIFGHVTRLGQSRVSEKT